MGRKVSWHSCLVFLLSIQALLMPIYGPWLDPGFAGRMPEHAHIYFGLITPYRHHPRPGPAIHIAHCYQQSGAQPLPGVVNLPPDQFDLVATQTRSSFFCLLDDLDKGL